MKPAKTQIIFAMLTLLALLATSCSRSTKFSPVLDGGYDPVAAFRKQGYTVQIEARGEGIRNAEYGYAWQSWCGTLTGTQKPSDCGAIAALIRDELNRTLSGSSLDALTVEPTRSAGQPLTGMLRYNKDSVHGDMHVWLMPDVANATTSYVIFVREERLK
jgi:hypothetical protein